MYNQFYIADDHDGLTKKVSKIPNLFRIKENGLRWLCILL